MTKQQKNYEDQLSDLLVELEDYFEDKADYDGDVNGGYSSNKEGSILSGILHLQVVKPAAPAKITVVENSDRCHVCINDTPEHTFIYYVYPEKAITQRREHALCDAKTAAFDTLARLISKGQPAEIDPVITRK
jgi:hypothetical protein